MILILVLVVPLIAGALALLARRRAAMEAINLVAFGVLLVLAVVLASQVLRAGTVSAWNGFLAADALSALVVLLTAVVSLACSVYAIGYFRDDEHNQVFETGAPGRITHAQLRKYYSLTPLFVFAMLMVALANNLGVMWVAIEGTTLATVFLITFYGRATSIEAAWKYAMIGGVGLSMALFGTILTYYSAHRVLPIETMAGLNWSVLAVNASHFDKTTMKLAFILILLGYGTKAGIAPMHTWKPDAYSEAPVPVAAMLAAAVLNCALYGLIRFNVLTTACLGPQFASQLLIVFGLLSVAVAVPFIVVQRSFRRLLAYSSIDHGGIMILALGFGGAFGALGMLLHMTFHSVTKPLLFFCAGNVEQHLKTDLFKRAKGGVIHAMPITGAIFLMAALAVTGTPPFSLFQSEFTILRAGFDQAYVVPAALLVVMLVIIFSGFLVHISGLVLGPDRSEAGVIEAPAESSAWKKYSSLALVSLIVILGFWLPGPVFQLIRDAAHIASGAR
jgi:hydrogenase-4 component F